MGRKLERDGYEKKPLLRSKFIAFVQLLFYYYYTLSFYSFIYLRAIKTVKSSS